MKIVKRIVIKNENQKKMIRDNNYMEIKYAMETYNGYNNVFSNRLFTTNRNMEMGR